MTNKNSNEIYQEYFTTNRASIFHIRSPGWLVLTYHKNKGYFYSFGQYLPHLLALFMQLVLVEVCHFQRTDILSGALQVPDIGC
jgi:hypothetical protein